MRVFRTVGSRILRRSAFLLASLPLLILVFGLSVSVAFEQAPPWRAPLPPGMTPGSPMRFAHVIGAGPNCQPNCPEWVSAEGEITAGAAQTFARFIAGLGGRRLPILINSGGGSTSDAMAMGRLIRAKRLVVAVAQTDLSPCPGATPNCALTPGVAENPRALCLSACSLVLAGGVERYVGALGAVGVHQTRLGPKTVVTRHFLVQYRVVDGKREEMSRALTGQDAHTVAPDAQDLAGVDATVESYLKEMGVGQPVMSLTLATPPSAIHLMTHDELATSRLATMWIFNSDWPLGVSSDGLKGSPVASSSAPADAFLAAPLWPMSSAYGSRAAAVAAEFRYRPGGGAVHASFELVDAATGAGLPRTGPDSYIVANAKETPIRLIEADSVSVAVGWLPRDVFCRLRGSRRAFVEFAEPSFESSRDERRREHLARIDFGSAPAAASLFADACSGPMAAAKR